MSSFKELKKRNNIKVWENKMKRLYSSENISDSDLKYLNFQFDLYTLRKTYIYMLSLAGGFIGYNFFIIRGMQKYKRWLSGATCALFIYNYFRKKNRLHYETIVSPYFEKYYIK